jgi:hypothetical protein
MPNLNTPVPEVAVFLSSPSDVTSKRQIVKKVIKEINEDPAWSSRCRLKVLAYEDCAASQMGKSAQRVVDDFMRQSSEADLVVCIVCNRMGTPTVDEGTGKYYASGTHYEFDTAYRRYRDSGQKAPRILLFLGNRPLDPKPSDAVFDQYHRARTFRKQLTETGEYQGLYFEYQDMDAFEELVRSHLKRHLAALLAEPPTAHVRPIRDLDFRLELRDEQLAVTDSHGGCRIVTPPWRDDIRFREAQRGFGELTSRPMLADEERAELVGYATTLGRLLFQVLFDGPALAHLRDAMIPGRPKPLLTLSSPNDALLALPWELLHLDGSFLVGDARLDIARTTAGTVGTEADLGPPTRPFKLVFNVSAPEGSGLDLEGETYRLTRRLSERCQLVSTEYGTADDLVETVARNSPTGIHFSGHGWPGWLLFEDEEGGPIAVAVADLLTRLRRRLPGHLPPFFYLAHCRGNEAEGAGEGQNGSESSAARLHREGVVEVVGYHGPVVDVLSTRAEVALYSAIADGQTTRSAVRAARSALNRPLGPWEDRFRPQTRLGPDTNLVAPVSFGQEVRTYFGIVVPG